jgi:uncharacterized protein YcbX
MTTVDPDTLERDPEVLRDIGRRFGGRLALNAEVLRPGAVSVGDPVKLVRAGDPAWLGRPEGRLSRPGVPLLQQGDRNAD